MHQRCLLFGKNRLHGKVVLRRHRTSPASGSAAQTASPGARSVDQLRGVGYCVVATVAVSLPVVGSVTAAADHGGCRNSGPLKRASSPP